MVKQDKQVHSHPRILIVDDNPQNLQVLGRLLQEENYDIEFATNGAAALEWINDHPFDLVLLDINMPEMDGFEACRKIRSDPSLDSLPVIFLSADANRESILKGFEMGGQDYVTKPFDSRELIVRVRTHIRLKDSLQQLENMNKILEEKVRERTEQLSIANENLEALNKKLTELDNAKSDFLNLISHEIRTPLNGIMGPLQILKDRGAGDEAGMLVSILDTSVKRLEKFSMNALLITRLRTRPGEIKQEDVNLGQVIEEVAGEFSEELNRKNLSLEQSIDKITDRITGQANLVSKCLANLLDNAIHFSPEGGTISMVKEIRNGLPVVEINDQGKGFPGEILKGDAVPFSTGRSYRDTSTGIGIPLSRMIMEAHRGKLELSNNKEGGARVTMIFNTDTENTTDDPTKQNPSTCAK